MLSLRDGKVRRLDGIGPLLAMSGDSLKRYVVHIGSVAMQELEWRVTAPEFLLGAALAIRNECLIRIDILDRLANAPMAAATDIMGATIVTSGLPSLPTLIQRRLTRSLALGGRFAPPVCRDN